MALTAKQQLFITEYLVDFNATQAAIRAGYSEKTAFSIGVENLKKPLIAEALAEAQKARSERVEWTADEILRDLKEIATDRAVEPKDRIKAYDLGGKHLGMWKERIEHSGAVAHEHKHNLKKLSTKELAELEQILAKSAESK